MGEGKEQTPLAVVSEISNINFVGRFQTLRIKRNVD